ncbi:MAG TPA: hypothetical protein VFZ53_26205 [Polyangiaceae bacterium]
MLTAPFAGFALGTLFAWLSREDLVRGAPAMLAVRSLVIVTLYALLVFGPAAAYFLVFEPAWAAAYLLEAGSHARAFDVVLAVLVPSSVVVGFLVTGHAIRRHRAAAALRIGAPVALVALALTLLLFPRLSVQATYAQYHGDFGTRPVAGTSLGWALVWFGTIVLVATLYVASVLRALEGKRA